ncbi:cell envelope integrity protein TolA [Paraburkholderia flava]|uniref:cell envelope integrity protein TolA n=1 Tax=Paraburkholderia flava TaxID=2547393 RepID=UPI00105E44F4|nr:cell envelope integrity protein TolA [Paraburkholderia flava]
MKQESAYPLQPPRERGTGRAIALAIVMHLLLGYFLYHGIQWQNSTPEGAEAELWTAVPDTTLPQPVPTPPVRVAPTPPVNDEEADIALQEKKRKQEEAARQAQLAEQQRQKLQAQQEAEADAKRQQQLAAQQAAQLAQQKAADAKQKQQQADKLRQQQLAEQQKQQQLEQQKEDQQKQAQADAKKKADADKAAKAKAQADVQAKKLDQERRARLAQMQGLAGGEGSTGNGLAKSGTGSGSGGTAISPGYADKVKRLVKQNLNYAGAKDQITTLIAVRCSPTGTVLSATIVSSSGNAEWDEAAMRAVRRSDPMPRDVDGKTPPSFNIKLTPAD